MHPMDNDERDRRDWPEATGGESDTPAVPEPDGEAEPVDASPADIESWPSQADAPAAADAWPATDTATGADDVDGGPPGDQAETRPWPTEPPEAGSASGWPTEAPERGDEPILEPASDAGWTADPESAPIPAEPEPVATEPEPVATEPEPIAAEPLTPESEPEPMAAAPSEVEAYPATPVPGPGVAATATPIAAHAVPDAESATGESTQCPRCGTENRPGLAFCRNCGQRLVAAGVSTTVERPGTPEGTMACPRCGTHNRSGVAFCQNCGANLRGTAAGYVPPAAPGEDVVVEPARRGAVLGPVVLLVGLVGLITGYLLPFAYGGDSLFDRAMGSGGYGIAFWNGYDQVGSGLANQAYFGLAAPIPILGLLLLALAVAGFVRAAPGAVQMAGLVIALLWAIGLVVGFGIVEVGGAWGGDIVGLLRDLSPAGIIFFLASLIVVIGVLTRFGRS